MATETNSDLFDNLRLELRRGLLIVGVLVWNARQPDQRPPDVAQKNAIYREAFNHAFTAHAGDRYQAESAHRIAWAAVKRSYVKVGGSWIGRDRT